MLTPAAGEPVGRDAGMTLTEVLVGMSLLLIVMTLAVNFFVGTGQTASRETGQTLTSADARVAVDQIATLLRLADTPTGQAGYATARFTTTTPSEVVFYSNVTPNRTGTNTRTPPNKVDLVASGSTLTEKLWAPITAYTTYPSGYNYATNYASTPTSTVVLTTRLANAGSVFTYCTNATDPTANCTTPTSPTSVAVVGVTLTLNGAAGENQQTAQTQIAITGALS